MPLDAVCLSGVLEEIRPQIVGLRIEKVQQPARDQVILSLRGGRRLLLCAGASQSRIHLTSLSRENPAAPPMFCMLLRKHLGGGRISAVEQPGLERAVILTVDMMDELGEPGQRKLILECMGRRSNLILTDGQDRIIDCLRRIDLEMNEERQVLPGLYYRLPPAQQKADPVAAGEELLRRLLHEVSPDTPADRFLLDTFWGLSPLVCREISCRGCGSCDALLDTSEHKEMLSQAFFQWQSAVKEKAFTPFLLSKDGHPSDFSYLPITQYASAMEGTAWESFSAMLDTFYETREQQERVRQKGQDLLRTASNARDRLKRKLALQEKEYAQTQQRDHLRICGELITANLYRMEKGQSLLRASNYYEEGCPEMDTPLDPLLTPQQNAARYFRQYNKAKAAEVHLSQQMEIARRERDWLESVLDELSRAETEQDFNDIRQELMAAGYGKKSVSAGKKDPRRGKSRPRAFRSSEGFRILVGRSNTQNDQLTREAFKSDYWFHTQRIHGSHVILCTEGREPDLQSLHEAAILAAWFSQGRESGQVAVDYTQVRHVRKPPAARPGMVIYDTYQTAYVVADETVVKKLSEDGNKSTSAS